MDGRYDSSGLERVISTANIGVLSLSFAVGRTRPYETLVCSCNGGKRQTYEIAMIR
jgi:hypothetical protein